MARYDVKIVVRLGARKVEEQLGLTVVTASGFALESGAVSYVPYCNVRYSLFNHLSLV